MELSERQRAILWAALNHYRATVAKATSGSQGMPDFLCECDEVITLLKASLPAPIDPRTRS